MPVDLLRARVAATSDAETVMALLGDATAWLAVRGSDQWQRMERRRAGVERDIAEGTLFVVRDRCQDVATITVDRLADADFWHRSDRVDRALYVHRMAVARSRSGEGIGSAMLDWAGRRARWMGRSMLRLDAWRTNPDLHKYYRKQHFDHVRTEWVRGRGSGALFERPVEVESREGPLVLLESVRPGCRAKAAGHH